MDTIRGNWSEKTDIKGTNYQKLTSVIDKKGELALFLHAFKRIWQKYI